MGLGHCVLTKTLNTPFRSVQRNILQYSIQYFPLRFIYIKFQPMYMIFPVYVFECQKVIYIPGINSNSWNNSVIFCWKMSGEFAIDIGRIVGKYFPQGMIIMHKLLVLLLIQIWYYPMFKSSYVAYWKTSNFNNISLILGIGYGSHFNCILEF